MESLYYRYPFHLSTNLLNNNKGCRLKQVYLFFFAFYEKVYLFRLTPFILYFRYPRYQQYLQVIQTIQTVFVAKLILGSEIYWNVRRILAGKVETDNYNENLNS